MTGYVMANGCAAVIFTSHHCYETQHYITHVSSTKTAKMLSGLILIFL